MHDRTDVEVVTVEIDATTAAIATRGCWPSWVKLVVGDAVEATRTFGMFDLIFADAEGGKWEVLDNTIAALRPSAYLVVDDMAPAEFVSEHHARKTSEVRTRLLDHPDLTSVEIMWSTGLILSSRKRS